MEQVELMSMILPNTKLIPQNYLINISVARRSLQCMVLIQLSNTTVKVETWLRLCMRTLCRTVLDWWRVSLSTITFLSSYTLVKMI